VYEITQKTSVLYCGKHLPRFLEERKRAGLLKRTEQYAIDQASALSALSNVPEVAEEPEITEELEVQEIAPKPVKKKTTKKTAK
jgi:hypothetical protein